MGCGHSGSWHLGGFDSEPGLKGYHAGQEQASPAPHVAGRRGRCHRTLSSPQHQGGEKLSCDEDSGSRRRNHV